MTMRAFVLNVLKDKGLEVRADVQYSKFRLRAALLLTFKIHRLYQVPDSVTR
jgi:hypothetical protein